MNNNNETQQRTMEKDYQKVWEECLGFIKDNLTGKENEKVFSTWFEPIVPLKLDGNTLIIKVPSPFFYEWLEQNYADLLKKTHAAEMEHLAELTDGYIASDIAYIVNDAAMGAAFSDKPITQQLLEETISSIHPSLSKEVVNNYENLRQKMEDTDARNRRPKIGFIK